MLHVHVPDSRALSASPSPQTTPRARAMATLPSPLIASLARAADAAWVASGGPPVDEATAAMAEAHSLQLCLLGLQHEISEISTGAAETPTPSGESVEAEAEADDGPVTSRLFEGHQVLDGGGFRTLQHAFATREECAQAPCTRHAHAVHTPCAHHAHTARFAHAMRLAMCEQVRAAATLGMVQSFRRGGQTTLSITPELRERLDGCGAASAVPCLEAVMERVQAAAQLALGGVLYPCGSLLIRLADPQAASLAAPWSSMVQVPCCECHSSLPWPRGAGFPGSWLRYALWTSHRAAQGPKGGCGAATEALQKSLMPRLPTPRCSWPLAPRQPYWSAHVDKHNVPFYDVSALCASPACRMPCVPAEGWVRVAGWGGPWVLDCGCGAVGGFSWAWGMCSVRKSGGVRVRQAVPLRRGRRVRGRRLRLP